MLCVTLEADTRNLETNQNDGENGTNLFLNYMSRIHRDEVSLGWDLCTRTTSLIGNSIPPLIAGLFVYPQRHHTSAE